MAKTVNQAFDIFLKNVVNLDSEQTRRARHSRDWMIGQVSKFQNDRRFPDLYPEIDMYFGSFARRTKIRELDDIDLMIGIDVTDSFWSSESDRIELLVPEHKNVLKRLCHPNTNRLNSRLVINQFVRKLKEIPQYEYANIKRNQEAATMKLRTHPWNFDIVPCILTTPNPHYGQFYLIPDGNGHWKPTNPEIDQARVSSINQAHAGIVLPVIRLVKYWQRRPTMPKMSSYLLECFVLGFYEGRPRNTVFLDLEFIDFLAYFQKAIHYEIEDPKQLQGNINQLADDEINKISARAKYDCLRASQAFEYEKAGDHITAIRLWREIFGDKFPKYC